MKCSIKVTQRRDAKPDYSNEEERYGLAKMLFQEAELGSSDPIEQVIEASWAAGFNGFDDVCLRLLAEFMGLFPIRWTITHGTISIQLGSAEDAICSNSENVNFWENAYLREEAARREPERWRIFEAEMEMRFRRHLT